jgi:peptidoglycan-associated lipoprotein
MREEATVKRYLSLFAILALVLSLGMVVGCGKEQVAAPGGQISAEEQARLEAERQRRMREAQLQEQQARATQLRELSVNQDIHFDYDRYDLSAEAKQILNEKSQYMNGHPELMVIVEGHCDERGSAAYNMALGEKRARAAAGYLEAMGIGPSRLETVSYGEERPLVMGTSEEAYAANRRAHFVIK